MISALLLAILATSVFSAQVARIQRLNQVEATMMFGGCKWRYKLFDTVNNETYCAIPDVRRDLPMNVIKCDITDLIYPFCIGVQRNWLRTGPHGGWCASIDSDNVLKMVRCNTAGVYPNWNRNKNYAFHNPGFIVEDIRTKSNFCPYPDLTENIWKVKPCDTILDKDGKPVPSITPSTNDTVAAEDD